MATKTELLKRVRAILGEDEEVSSDAEEFVAEPAGDEVDSDEDFGVEGEEEVETLSSYVAGVEDSLSDEQKEDIKAYIQSKIEEANAGAEGEVSEEPTEEPSAEVSAEEPAPE